MAYRAQSSTFVSGATSLSLTAPGGTAADDILVLFFGLDGNPTLTGPTGYTLKSTVTNAGLVAKMFWRRATATSADNVSVSWTGSRNGGCFLMAFSGRLASGDPFSDADTNTDNVLPTLTAEANDDLVGYSIHDTVCTHTPPSTYTEAGEQLDSATIYRNAVSAGSYGGADWNNSSYSVPRIIFASLKVAAAGGGAKPWLYRNHTHTLGAGFGRTAA